MFYDGGENLAIQKTITINEETYLAIKKYVDENGLKLSTLINVLIVKYLREHGVEVENKYD